MPGTNTGEAPFLGGQGSVKVNRMPFTGWPAASANRTEPCRICVHDVIGLPQNGETVDSVTRQLPGLTRAQVYECLAYYEDHLAEIDYLVARQMADAET